jgi:hypothetical protein
VYMYLSFELPFIFCAYAYSDCRLLCILIETEPFNTVEIIAEIIILACCFRILNYLRVYN